MTRPTALRHADFEDPLGLPASRPSALAAISPRDVESPPKLVRTRCACQRCGAHTITKMGFVVAGNCSVCGSYMLTPLGPA